MLPWASIIVLAVFIYVVPDGFDLGFGILFRRFPAGPDRDTAMNSIAPVWDGNETWLVMGGGGLLAAFPLVKTSRAWAPRRASTPSGAITACGARRTTSTPGPQEPCAATCRPSMPSPVRWGGTAKGY